MKTFIYFPIIIVMVWTQVLDAQVQKWYYEDFSEDAGGWIEPDMSPNPPVVIEDGQVFLRNESSGGDGAGSKWVMTNTSSHWTGDYDEAEVEVISMNVRNAGDQSIHLRLAFSNDNGAHFVNTQAITVLPGSGWNTIHFSLDDDELVVNSGGNIEDIMSSVSAVRLLSNTNPAWKGEAIEATIEIDNILMTGDTDYKTYLTGENQLPGVSTEAYGILYFEEENDTLTVWGSLSGIESGVDTSIAGGMHIHTGIAGQNGGVIFPVQAAFNDDLSSADILPEQNQFALTENQLEMLDDQGLYVNVHSMDFSGGEIRGQILDADEEIYRSNLHGSNEVPAILSPAEGRIVMELDSNELTLSGSFHNLSAPLAESIAGGGHIHMALPGSNGGVEIPLHIEVDSTGRSGILWADSNEYDLTPDQVNAIRARKLYINIHSLNYNGGEIRGQIISGASLRLFRAYLSGTNEVPMVMTRALGIVNVELLSPDSILIFGSYAGLSSPLNTSIAGGIHLHGGMAGENAGVLFPISNTQDSDTDGTIETQGYPLDSMTYELLMNRSTYINLHSENHGSGEIRGQVLSDAPWHFTATLTSSQELSAAVSNGYGSLKGEWNGRQLILSGAMAGLSTPIATAIAGGGHIHQELPGRNGGVIFPLNLDISEDGLNATLHADSNVYILADSIAQALVRRGLYANIHTENYNSGEIRGQLLFDAAIYAAAIFSGSMQNPPVNTTGKGLVLGEINPQSANLVGSVSSLSSPIDTSIAGGAHLHHAVAGRNGPVLIPISIDPDPDMTGGELTVSRNQYTSTDTLIDLLAKRSAYLNVHTTNHGSGEVRGQILPLASYYLSANLSGQNEVPSIDSSGMGTVLAEVNGNQATLSGSFNDLTAPLASHIAGGAHIHTAPAGENGEVLIPISSQVSEDSLSGVFWPDSNKFDSGENNLLDMIWNGLYVNIHSNNYPSGEVRGQLLPMINFFPIADSVILTSGDKITLDTTNMNTNVKFEWTPAMDDNFLVYQLEWGVDSTFDTVLFRSPSTTENSISLGDSALLDTLMDMGYFAESDSACFMIRIRATDGSLIAHSPAQDVCVILGVRTNREDPLQSVVRISPVPARNQITLTIRNYKDFRTHSDVKVSIYNLSGQLMKQSEFRLYDSYHKETIDIQSLPTGQYFLLLNRAVWPFIKL